MTYFVTFLLDLAGSGENRAIPGTVAYASRPKDVPKTAFVWKVTCDADGKVVVRALENKRGLAVIATARWRGGDLGAFRQRDKTCPTGYQWNLVEASIAAEQARRALAAPADPGAVEDFPDLGELSERDRDWSANEPEPARAPLPRARVRTRGQRTAAVLAAMVGAGLSCAVLASLFCTGSKDSGASSTPVAMPVREEPVAPAPPAPEPPVPPTPPTPERSAEERVAAAASFAEAIAIARPAMTDTHVELDGAATLLARYAPRMTWADVDVAPDTTLGHVLKDPEAERGKHLCAKGAIERIERRDVERRKVYVGALRTDDGDQVAFVAVGTTGELVKRSRGTLCGVVLGRAGEAASLFGMFDLPENRAPVVEQ